MNVVISNLSILAIAVSLLAACGTAPRPPVTIPDPMAYLVQSRGTNGDVSTPLRAEDPMVYRRFDFGREQASDSFLTSPTTAITTWGYAPFGPFIDANGDGGETYELRGGVVRITSTKHLGIPTTPISWVTITGDTVDCASGWTGYNSFERGCRAVVAYPAIGPVDTVISEHRHPFESTMERIFLARGWGRLARQTLPT